MNIDNILQKIDKMVLTERYDNNTIEKYEDRHEFLFEIALCN